jgi:hypothetical protein
LLDRMMPISAYYLGTTPAAPIDSPSYTRPQSMSQPSSQSPSSAASQRASMPPPSRNKSITPPTTSAFVNQPTSPETRNRSSHFEPTPEETAEDDTEDVQLERTSPVPGRKNRSGVMNKDFKFPPSTSSELPVKKAPPPPLARESLVTGPDARKPNIITPSSVEVPPPPVNKKSTSTHSVDDVEEDVGPTEEISLN